MSDGTGCPFTVAGKKRHFLAALRAESVIFFGILLLCGVIVADETAPEGLILTSTGTEMSTGSPSTTGKEGTYLNAMRGGKL